VAARNTLALETILLPAARVAAQPPPVEAAPRLNIAVVYTSREATLAAIGEAERLAGNLSARLDLIVPQVVPYPLPLESPPVLVDFSEQRLRELAGQSRVEIAVRIYLCRDSGETLAQVLRPGSLVVLAGRRRWWPTRESGLARKLKRAGHEVVFKRLE
jgi:hypothetical protein